jgi:hypothetical protein
MAIAKIVISGATCNAKSFNFANHKHKTHRIIMRHFLAITILLLALSTLAKAKVSYTGKIEFGYMRFEYHPIQVDPGPGWKGYYLSDNGIYINSINGLSNPGKKLFAGIGLGYLNFKGINGVSVFADFDYLPLKTRLTPVLNFRLGYDHVWNQYEGGTGTKLAEFGIGMIYKLTRALGISLKTGVLLTQQSAFIPITLVAYF